ncbi:MAG: phosphotransferase [Caldilineaceae bacterium]
MNLVSLFVDTVGQAYATSNFVLHPLIQEGGRQLYRVERADASPWLLRAYAYPQSAGRQEQHANVLKLLEKYGYPAPRLILTRHGQTVTELISEEAVWQLVMTTFIEGDLIEGDTPATLRCMGEALGHFHRFSQSLSIVETQHLSSALWRPATMIPLVQEQLATIEPTVSLADRASTRRFDRRLQPFPHLIIYRRR